VAAPGRISVLLMARELNFGGSERQLCEMAKALDPAKFAVHVGAFYSGGARAREVEARGIPVVEIPVRSFKSPSNMWASARKLRRYIREQGIQIVHGFDPPTCAFLGLAAPFLRRATVLTSQRNYRNVRTRGLRQILRISDKFTDGIVVNCEAMRRHLTQDEGVGAGGIHLCYNGLDAERFHRLPAGAEGIVPPGALVIGTVCLFRVEKDLGTLVRAFAAVQDAHPNLFLLMVGDGAERPGLERLAGELGVASKARLQTAAVDVVPWLSLLDIFALRGVLKFAHGSDVLRLRVRRLPYRRQPRVARRWQGGAVVRSWRRRRAGRPSPAVDRRPRPAAAVRPTGLNPHPVGVHAANSRDSARGDLSEHS
jgi:glycosyltransferase involved in cell wall biosynthesis